MKKKSIIISAIVSILLVGGSATYFVNASALEGVDSPEPTPVVQTPEPVETVTPEPTTQPVQPEEPQDKDISWSSYNKSPTPSVQPQIAAQSIVEEQSETAVAPEPVQTPTPVVTSRPQLTPTTPTQDY